MKDAPLWSRVSRRMWRSTDFRALGPIPPSAPSLWAFLITGEHGKSVPGLFVLGVGTIADDLRWTPDDVRKHLAVLTRKKHVKFDPTTNVMWVPKALEHNWPDNPNVVVGWKRDWQSIPQCALKDEARASLRERLVPLKHKCPEGTKNPDGSFTPHPSQTPYADNFDIVTGDRPPNPSPNPKGKDKPKADPKPTANLGPNVGPKDGGNVTPPVTGTLGVTERERAPDSPKPPPRADASAPAHAHEGDPNPEVVVDEPKATEPRTPEPEAPPADPAAQPERPMADVVTLLSPADRNAGEALAQAMATASGGMFDPLSGSTAKRAELYRRLKHYRITLDEAVVMGECCAEPGKTWKWATTISNGFGLGFLLGSETAEGFSGDALSQLVQIARKRIAAVQRAELAKAEEAARQPVVRVATDADREAMAELRRKGKAALLATTTGDA